MIFPLQHSYNYIAIGSFHIKSTKCIIDPLGFSRNLVCREHSMRECKYQNFSSVSIITACFFTFDMVSNATPCEKLSKELQVDTNIIGFTANVEVLRCRKAIPEGNFSRYLASPRESQIKTLWSDRDQCNYNTEDKVQEIEAAFLDQRQIKSYAYRQFHFHFHNEPKNDIM